MQGTYGNQYEKDIAGLFGVGSPEHFASIGEQMEATPAVEAQGGWLNGVVDGLLGAIGIDTSGGSSDDDSPIGNNNGGGGSSGGNSGFHGADHNWN
jgi:hypothetical protein